LRNEINYTVEKMCTCTKGSKNAYYNWLKNKDIPKISSPTLHLKKQIRITFEKSKEIYGSHRIQKSLERQSLNYSPSYIGLLMKEMG
jgi:putative transposase